MSSVQLFMARIVNWPILLGIFPEYLFLRTIRSAAALSLWTLHVLSELMRIVLLGSLGWACGAHSPCKIISTVNVVTSVAFWFSSGVFTGLIRSWASYMFLLNFER